MTGHHSLQSRLSTQARGGRDKGVPEVGLCKNISCAQLCYSLQKLLDQVLLYIGRFHLQAGLTVSPSWALPCLVMDHGPWHVGPLSHSLVVTVVPILLSSSMLHFKVNGVSVQETLAQKSSYESSLRRPQPCSILTISLSKGCCSFLPPCCLNAVLSFIYTMSTYVYPSRANPTKYLFCHLTAN